MKTLSAIRNSARTLNPEPRALNEAERYLVGGVNSPVRAFRQIGCDPLMLVKGPGAEVVDTRGRRYIDFIGGWGAPMLGHPPPALINPPRPLPSINGSHPI